MELLIIPALRRIIPTTWLVMATIIEAVGEEEEALVVADEVDVKEVGELDPEEGINPGMLICKMVGGIRLRTPHLKTQRLPSNRPLAQTNHQQRSKHTPLLDVILQVHSTATTCCLSSLI